jgi:hypothetical protein
LIFVQPNYALSRITKQFVPPHRLQHPFLDIDKQEVTRVTEVTQPLSRETPLQRILFPWAEKKIFIGKQIKFPLLHHPVTKVTPVTPMWEK